MNREIKFRAWNKENETMLPPFSFEDISTQNYAGESWLWLGENELINTKLSDLVLMQFTGIQDKNGKDIYEGDIVFKFYGDNSLKERLKGAKGVVKFGRYLVLKDDWGMDNLATGWHMTFSDNSGSIEITEKFEVIGNIYENPELLPSNER